MSRIKKLIIAVIILLGMQAATVRAGQTTNVAPKLKVLGTYADNSGAGGTITYTDSSGLNPRSYLPYNGGYVVHVFTNSGTLSIPDALSGAEVLVVAGGGAGGLSYNCGGGGGAGGLIYSNGVALNAGSIQVTVGAGGASAGAAGSNSAFGAITATGGGGGNGDGRPGGSGGGGKAESSSGGPGIHGQGYNGAAGSGSWSGPAGGGGGAGGAGSLPNGGAGVSNAISGAVVWYAGGGGGGVGNGANPNNGKGGSGIGGTGGCIGWFGTARTATSGAANTGSGGGGGDSTSFGSGGSGIVIVRYPYISKSFWVTVTAPKNGAQVLTNSPAATVVIVGGVAPYKVTFYTNSAVAWSTNGTTASELAFSLGSPAVGRYKNYATVTDSVSSKATSSTNTFTAVAVDKTAPTPNPMTFAVNPAGMSTNIVVMTATTATDELTPPVQYYFENTTNSDNSGWISGTVWTNTGLTLWTTYGYRVKARDALGVETAFSAIFNAAPLGVAMVPSGLSTWATNALVTLRWSAATNATGYMVKRSLVPGGPYTTIGYSATTDYNDSTVTNGVAYYYVVSAINAYSATNSAEGAAWPPYADSLVFALGLLKNHVNGVTNLTAAQIAVCSAIIRTDAPRFADSTNIIQALFNLVRTYDTTTNFGPLFVNSALPGDRKNQSDTNINFVMLNVMQSIFDRIYTTRTVSKYPSVLNGFKFECSSRFPGACAAPAVTNRYTVAVNASHPKSFGRMTGNSGGFARRPTGAYAVAGTVVKVTVPSALVGQGYKIRVGCHSWDHGQMRRTLERLDRVSLLYDIVSTDTLVANPLGGSLYIEVPYLASNGVVNVTFTGAARSPLCRVTAVHRTTPAEWLAERIQPGPWADFETDKYMMQVPRSWIYALDDPFTVLADWGKACDAANDLMGFSRVPSKPLLYQQIDITMRGNVSIFPGYPFNNDGYDPTRDYGGSYTNHFFLSGPRNEFYYVWHETGHAFYMPQFGGESESVVDLVNVAVHNRAFGMPLDEAFAKCLDQRPVCTVDNVAVLWMTSFNFSPRKTHMSRAEMDYQPGGLAKYIDLVRLYGWKGLDAFFYHYNSLDDKKISYPGDNDSLLLQLCKSVGKDLRPLFHFWGTNPMNPTNLAAQVAAAGLTPPPEIRDQLLRYKTLVPANNAAYQSFCTNWWGRQPSTNGYFVEQEHARQWNTNVLVSTNQQVRFPTEMFDETAAAAVKTRVQEIIDLYYQPGGMLDAKQASQKNMRIPRHSHP